MSRRFVVIQIIFIAIACAIFFATALLGSMPLAVYGRVSDFKLKNQDNVDFGLSELRGKVWVADFIFTTCGGICPMMSKRMASLNQEFLRRRDVRLVSISVNPDQDTPSTLKHYAAKYQAGQNWIFLTGPREDIQKLAIESFKLGDMKEIVQHSPSFVLVDRQAKIRGYYDSGDPARMDALRHELNRLERQPPLLPTINATLNGMAGIFLTLGFLAIRRKDRVLHRRFMMTAVICSAIFLCCYVYYHATTHFLTRYPGHGIWKGIYYLILGTHTPLAALIVPFIILAVRHAWRGDIERHKRITRWLYPVWTYVSVTGVLVYLMLYVFKPS